MIRRKQCFTAALVLAIFIYMGGTADAKVSHTTTGSVIFGYDTTCGSSQNGAIRYNSATSVWNYCNGSAWTGFAGTVCATGSFWTQRNKMVFNGPQGVAMSSDGSKIIGVQNQYGDSSIYTSTDGGVTWTNRNSASGTRDWRGAASSSDGTKLAAVAYGGHIYTSTDSGVSWTDRSGAGTQNFLEIVSSSDGTKLAALIDNGDIITSPDSGASWVDRTAAGSRSWTGLAMSADGTKLAATDFGGQIYLSSDSGASWTAVAGIYGYWRGISMSADGTKLIAVAYGGSHIYISSDSGATWTDTGFVKNIVSVSQTTDGTRAIIADQTGLVYTSKDGGATWTARTTGSTWSGAVISGDGSLSLIYGRYPETVATSGGACPPP